MDKELQTALEVMESINNDSMTMTGSTLLHLETCADYVGLLYGDTVVWDNQDEQSEGGDFSSESITAHIMEQLALKRQQLEDILAVYTDEE